MQTVPGKQPYRKPLGSRSILPKTSHLLTKLRTVSKFSGFQLFTFFPTSRLVFVGQGRGGGQGVRGQQRNLRKHTKP